MIIGSADPLKFRSESRIRAKVFTKSADPKTYSPPSTLQYLKLYFFFSLAVFRCLSNDIAFKGFLLQHCIVLPLFCVISEPFFLAGAYFRPDLAAIRRKKFAAPYFWFKAKLKQKKIILK